MTGSQSSLSSTTLTTVADNEAALEDTPLLGDIQPQTRTRRKSSVVGNTEHGYHAIPANFPDEQIEPPQQSLRAVLGILSVLLIGE
jgi:hypothetical protein